jgi:hypothetical protein
MRLQNPFAVISTTGIDSQVLTVLERVTGRSFSDALNRDHLLAGAILQIAAAKTELISRMAQIVFEWQIQPLTVKISGSAARKDMRTDSDIDLLVVMPDSAADEAVDEAVGHLAAQTTLWTGNDVRPLVYRSSEVRQASIFTSILEGGIDISEDPYWLRERLRNKGKQRDSEE